MKAQLGRLPEWFEYFSALIRTHEGSVPPFLGPYVNYVKHVPLGVCALITPWNHPLLIAIKKIAPAIACGNSIVLKPSELAPVTSVITELGGKAPMLIFEDADLDQAVNGAAFATFVASGQTCIMGARVLIHESKYDEFLSKLSEKAKKIRLGNPFDMTTQMGPVISGPSRERITGLVDRAKAAGALVHAGGKSPSVKNNMEIWKEEVFGPVVVAIPFKTEEEAIFLANDSPFGLAAAVWTRDVMRAHRVAEEMDVGIVWINDHHRNDPSSPWGGTKDSGVGRENGTHALQEYSQTRSVVVRTEDSAWDWFEQPNARYS
eukprot:GSChrysophyteH1.ASY1.ANO1.2023.1 assembled CDS